MTANNPTHGSGDFLRSPTAIGLWWVLPLAIGWTSDFVPIADAASRFVWAGVLAWMGLGCALNARRCRRLHCTIAAPVLLAGAVGAALAGLGFEPLGPRTASWVINISLGLALLSFLAEPIWGRYRAR